MKLPPRVTAAAPADDVPQRDARQLKNRGFVERLGFAIAGIAVVARRERSFRTQMLLGCGALATAAAMRPALVWWAVLALSIGLVLALECLNGALEYALDCLHPDLHPQIGRAKDAAAGAVLVASIASACVGGLMLLSSF